MQPISGNAGSCVHMSLNCYAWNRNSRIDWIDIVCTNEHMSQVSCDLFPGRPLNSIFQPFNSFAIYYINNITSTEYHKINFVYFIPVYNVLFGAKKCIVKSCVIGLYVATYKTATRSKRYFHCFFNSTWTWSLVKMYVTK